MADEEKEIVAAPVKKRFILELTDDEIAHIGSMVTEAERLSAVGGDSINAAEKGRVAIVGAMRAALNSPMPVAPVTGVLEAEHDGHE